MTRVVVIGAGLAAHAAARAAGAGVERLGRAPGGAALGPGLLATHPWRELVERFGPAALSWPDQELLARVRRLLPAHPLGVLTDPPVEAAEAWFSDAFGFVRQRGIYATADGRLLGADLCAATLAAGELTRLGPARVAVARRAHAWPPGPETGDRLNAAAAGLGLATSFSDLVLTPDGEPGASPAELARRLGDPEAAARLGASIAQAIGPGIDLVAIPGLIGDPDLLAKVAAAAGIRVFELAGPPPSAIGYRLQLALDQLGGSRAEVTGHEASGRRLVAVTGQGSQGDFRVEADAFVLATGTFLGGGIRRRDTLREALFGLDLGVGDRPASELWEAELAGGRSTPLPPVFTAGVGVDERLRPLDAAGRPAFDNLHAAGAILAGAGGPGEGGGLALVTGWAAGRIAAGSEVPALSATEPA
ncbi:MAG: FAD-binding protein [Candidatus Dormibacteria bacterium]